VRRLLKLNILVVVLAVAWVVLTAVLEAEDERKLLGYSAAMVDLRT
jgi:hypothetical protein